MSREAISRSGASSSYSNRCFDPQLLDMIIDIRERLARVEQRIADLENRINRLDCDIEDLRKELRRRNGLLKWFVGSIITVCTIFLSFIAALLGLRWVPP